MHYEIPDDVINGSVYHKYLNTLSSITQIRMLILITNIFVGFKLAEFETLNLITLITP